MVEDMLVLTSRFLTGFRNLLLCAVIEPIVGVCPMQFGKPFQIVAYQWPFSDKLNKEMADLHE